MLLVSMPEVNLDPVKTGWPWVGATQASDVCRYFHRMSLKNYPVRAAIHFFGGRNRAVSLSRGSWVYVLCVLTPDHGYSP